MSAPTLFVLRTDDRRSGTHNTAMFFVGGIYDLRYYPEVPGSDLCDSIPVPVRV